MAKEKRKYWIILVFFIFVAYVFVAAQPIPVETILVPRWLSSLESDYSTNMLTENSPSPDYLVPFKLGNRFGYVNTRGQFTINQPIRGAGTSGVSLSEDRWAEFKAVPETIHIRNPQGESLTTIENGRGYPLFLDGKIFLIGEDQTSLSLVEESGEILWTYDFAAPLTSIDAGSDLILTGSLDGTVELLDASGKRVYSLNPGGSRLAVILGCRISQDGLRLAIISGYDDQRFLLLEQFGNSYRIVYHEFLEDGFRHAVHMAFVENDKWIVFERQGGLGLYEIETRRSIKVPLNGTITALDETGNSGLIFVISSLGGASKNLVAIRLPGIIVMQAAFKSETAFLSRRGSELYVGGGMTLASFELEER
ncbi:hypothetical protein [Treponema primitia]|uniref:hypothetical protein n=1 Tax=Treponema primitia TaxID=88058 RepID=UPI0002555420|nr:hypothetical protein [Treponema primitia]